MSIRSAPLLVFTASVILLAGCGGSNKKASPPAASPTISTAATTTTTSTSAAPTFASTANCRQLQALGTKFAQAMQNTSGSAETRISTYAKAFQAMANAAPAQIHGDFETLASAFNSYINAFVKAGIKAGQTPTAAQMVRLEAALKAFNTPKLRGAEQHLEAWVRANCTK